MFSITGSGFFFAVPVYFFLKFLLSPTLVFQVAVIQEMDIL
jgi:hypothetical protein